MTPSIFHISSIYLWSMKIPNREFSHQPYKASSVVTSHGQLDHFTCICRSNMCGCGYVCHMMQARTKPRLVMMSNLNQKHHHTTTATCVCLVYNTQTQSLSDPGWQSLQASNTWRQLNVMPSTITPELMFECIHSWKLPNKAWWQAMLTPSFFLSRNPVVSARCCVLRAPSAVFENTTTKTLPQKHHSRTLGAVWWQSFTTTITSVELWAMFENTTTKTPQKHNQNTTSKTPQKHKQNTTSKTPPQKHNHNTTTTTTKHHHKNTTTNTPPQKHHHKNTTKTPPQNTTTKHHRKNTTTKHHHKNTTTKTPAHHHKNITTTPPHHHHKNTTTPHKNTTTRTPPKKHQNTTAPQKRHRTTTHHKNATAPPHTTKTPPKHNHNTTTTTTTTPATTTTTTTTTTKTPVFSVRVARRRDKFAFYHSFERPTRTKWRKGRSATSKICVLKQFWASDTHEVTRGLSNPQVRPLRPDRKKNIF